MVDKELLKIFISESNEEIKKINKISINLSKKYNQDSIIELDRLLHTLKGNSSLMGYNDFSDLAHNVEDVIKKVNNKEIPSNNDFINLLLSATDWMTDYIKNINKPKKPSNKKIMDLIKDIKQKRQQKTKNNKPKNIVNVNDFKYQTSETVRVKNKDLDLLLNLSSEIQSNISSLEKTDVLISNHLNNLTRQLQQKIIELRLIPLDDVFSNYPRMIRDLCLSENKDVDLKIITNGVKLDRSIIEHINAPMVHLLRNAVDHGIETPDKRRSKNKPPNGKVTVSVEKEKASAIIKVSDDGNGIDLDNVLKIAITKKLTSPSKKLNRTQILDFIFLPGFTTKTKVTKVSGRGIGMNIVRNNIVQMGGSLKVETKKNKGTTFIMKVPLNLSILTALIIGNNDRKFAIPLINILSIGKYNKKLQKENKYHYKNKDYPFLSFNKLMNLGDPKIKNIILLDTGNEKKVLGVQNIFEKREILIKKLDNLLSKMKGIGGSTIINRDNVCFVLDINNLR